MRKPATSINYSLCKASWLKSKRLKITSNQFKCVSRGLNSNIIICRQAYRTLPFGHRVQMPKRWQQDLTRKRSNQRGHEKITHHRTSWLLRIRYQICNKSCHGDQHLSAWKFRARTRPKKLTSYCMQRAPPNHQQECCSKVTAYHSPAVIKSKWQLQQQIERQMKHNRRSTGMQQVTVPITIVKTTLAKKRLYTARVMYSNLLQTAGQTICISWKSEK